MAAIADRGVKNRRWLPSWGIERCEFIGWMPFRQSHSWPRHVFCQSALESRPPISSRSAHVRASLPGKTRPGRPRGAPKAISVELPAIFSFEFLSWFMVVCVAQQPGGHSGSFREGRVLQRFGNAQRIAASLINQEVTISSASLHKLRLDVVIGWPLKWTERISRTAGKLLSQGTRGLPISPF